MENKKLRIENWSITSNRTPYTAPECIQMRIVGAVYNHSKFKDGDMVTTSAVVKEEGKVATTVSGSVYELGTPDPGWVQWMKDNNVPWDPENPLKKLTN